MRKFDVLVTEKAFSDLKDIQQYIENDLHQTRIAEDILSKIEKSIFTLELMPLKHPISRDAFLVDKGIQKPPLENYLFLHSFRSRQQNACCQGVV